MKEKKESHKLKSHIKTDNSKRLLCKSGNRMYIIFMFIYIFYMFNH